MNRRISQRVSEVKKELYRILPTIYDTKTRQAEWILTRIEHADLVQMRVYGRWAFPLVDDQAVSCWFRPLQDKYEMT